MVVTRQDDGGTSASESVSVQKILILPLSPERLEYSQVTAKLLAGTIRFRLQHFQDLKLERPYPELQPVGLQTKMQRGGRAGAPGKAHLAFQAGQVEGGAYQHSPRASVNDPENAGLWTILFVFINELFAARSFRHRVPFPIIRTRSLVSDSGRVLSVIKSLADYPQSLAGE
jgi:hypothetical protein